MKKSVPLSLLFANLATVAGAEICVGPYSDGWCNVVLSVVPALEETSIPVADVSTGLNLGSTDEGKPFAAITYFVRTDPMTEAAIADANVKDLAAIASKFTRDMYRIQCGQQARMGIVGSGETFVNAGGEVSYHLGLGLMMDAERMGENRVLAQTYIASCEAN